MYNSNLKKNRIFLKDLFKELNDKILSGRLSDPEKRKSLVAFLNRYSLLFHALLACSICFLIEWVSRHSFVDAFTFVFDRSLVYLYNSMIVFASLMLVYLFRRRVLARMVISVFWLFLGTINGCVLLKRVTPFSYTDLKMVGDLLTMRQNYFNTLEEILVIAGVLAVIFLLIFVWFKGPKFQGKTHRLASILFIGVLTFFIPMVTNAAVSSNVLAGYFENIAQGYSDYGFVYSFSASVVDRGMSQPEDYSAETIDAITGSIPSTVSESAQDTPNVICVLLESFVDPYEFNFLQFDKDPVPNFHRLYDNYTSGHLQVPVVGAGTANTEFEILTGMGMQFFGLGEYPYKTVLKTTSCESVADVFSDLGYGTHVVHNNGGNFYSRANAFSQMGFDTFTSKEMINIQEWTPLGTWPTDHCLIDEVEKTLDLTPDSPDFTYTITVQGHGIYPTEPVLDNPEIKVTGASTEEDNYAWEYYVNMQHEVDTFIGDLIDMLSQRDEKTIVVLFGDHLPTMEGLTEADMATGSLFETKYVTWNNFGMKDASKDLTSFQLMPYIMDQLDIHDGTMVTYHQSRDYQISEEYEHDMELLQYDILYGDRYAYKGLDLYPPSDLVMGVEDITVDSFMSDEEYLSVFGSNFTPWSRVFVNGEMVSTTFINDRQLQIEESELSDGENTIQVNQMGSSNTVFRSSNEAIYIKDPQQEEDSYRTAMSVIRSAFRIVPSSSTTWRAYSSIFLTLPATVR